MKLIEHAFNTKNGVKSWIFWLAILILPIFFLPGNTRAENKNLSFLNPMEQEWLTKLNKPIRLAPDPGFIPMEVKGPNGELLGLAGDYIDILQKTLGISFKIVWYDTWAESVHQAEKGNVDLWSAVVSTPQRRKYMLFTEPYTELQPVFIVPDSKSEKISFETMGDKRLLLVEGWFHQDLIESHYPHINLSFAPSMKDALITLQNGKADVVVGNTMEVSHIIQALHLKGLRIAGDAPLGNKDLSMACRRDWPLFRSILDKTLARITDHQRKEIYQRWVSLGSREIKNQKKWYKKISMFIYAGGTLFIIFVFIRLYLGTNPLTGSRPRHQLIIIFISIFFLICIGGLVWKYTTLLPGSLSNDLDLTREEKIWLSSLEAPLTVAPDCGFAPVEWIDSNGIFKGIAADYLRLVEKKLGTRFSIIQIRNWKKNVAAAKRGKFDIWTAVSATPEKRQYMNFSTPHIKLTSALIVNSDDSRDFTLETINSQRVAVVQNYFTHDYMNQHYPNIKLDLVANAKAAMRALAFRQVDAVFADVATAAYIIKQEGISSLEVRQTMDIGYNLSFASKKDLPILSRILDKAVISISAQEHDRIMEKWTGSIIGNRVELSRIIEISLIVIAVLLVMLAWSLSLRRLVKIRTRELTAAKESLIKANSYITNIVDSMPSILVGVDTHGRITQWNKTAEQNRGVTFATAQGKKLVDLFPHMKSVMKIIDESIQNRETKQVLKKYRQVEDHKTIYEDVIVYPLITNSVEGAVIRIDDVTEKVRMEEMMIQNERMLSVGGLAAGMAHEINNPLAGMMQTANVMSDRLTQIEMKANLLAASEANITMEGINAFMEKRGILRMVKTIKESGQRMAEIVDNMLSFARKNDALNSSHNPAELMDKILELAGTDYDLKKQYDFKTIEIIKEYEDNLPMVACEGSKIQQVLFNILRNGAQAMQAAPGNSDLGVETSPLQAPRFILRLAHEDKTGMIRIEIEDNGPGMDEKIRKRIFEPFFTTKPEGMGTGLGLSVSYFIITENHGGTMDVVSEPGKGARFIIHLPLEG